MSTNEPSTLTVMKLREWIDKHIPSDDFHLDQPIELNVHFKCAEDLEKTRVVSVPSPHVSGKLVILGDGKSEYDWSKDKEET